MVDGGGGDQKQGASRFVSVALRRWPQAGPFLLLAGGACSLALFHNFGYHSGPSFALLALAMLSLVAGTVLLQRGLWPSDARADYLAGALVAWLAVAVALAASDDAWSYFLRFAPHQWQPATARVLMLVGLGLVALGTVRDSRWTSIARLGAFGLALVLGAQWTIEQTPEPTIDVWHMHSDASDRLLHGKDPYDPSFQYYGRTIDFYAYPPVTLLLQVPFHALLGDVRYASVAGLLVAGWAACQLGRRAGLPQFAADAAGALLVVQGRPFYMIEQAWTEPVVSGLVGVAALAWASRSQWVAAAAALALASKQFLWAFVPLVVRMPGVDRRSLAIAAVVLVAVFLPFFAWGPERFWYGVVETHVNGEAVTAAYPNVPPGDPWPGSSTLAIHLRQYDIEWPLWTGTVLWLAAAAGFAVGRERGLGALVVSAAAGVALVSFFGAAFHPNYIWLLPTLLVLGVLADRARCALPPASAASPGPGPASPSKAMGSAKA